MILSIQKCNYQSLCPGENPAGELGLGEVRKQGQSEFLATAVEVGLPAPAVPAVAAVA